MILAAMLAAIIVIAGNVILALLAVRYVEAQKRAAIDAVQAYIAADGDKPSQFALIVDAMSTVAAQRIVNTAKASLLGMAGVDARNEKRLQADMVQDLAAQASPLLGMAMKMFPQVGKRLAKNPDLVGAAASMFGGMFKTPGNGHTPAEGTGGMVNYNKYG